MRQRFSRRASATRSPLLHRGPARFPGYSEPLPQTTALALALGQILSGAVLVEVIFGYPGIGALLFQAIRENDFFLIQGIVFTVIVALGLATFVLDVVYPWLDPRISYRRT